MKGNLFSLLTLFMCLKLTAQPTLRSSEFEKFKSKFSLVKTPYDSRILNKDPMKVWSVKSNELDLKSCVKFFFGGDPKKAEYRYQKFDMMEGKPLGWVTEEYNFYSVFRIEDERFIFLGFMQSDTYSYQCYLAIFLSKDLVFVDTLKVNEISSDGNPAPYFIASLIDKNLLSIYKYEITPEGKLPNDKSIEINRTTIRRSIYEIDFDNRKLKRLSYDSILSHCQIEDIFFNKRNCGAEDPMSK